MTTSGKSSSSNQPPPFYDSLEFQLTDIGEARQVLDELPPGILERERLDPNYWPSRRRPPQPSDRALTGEAVNWLMALPPPQRPQRLALQYPRLANAICTVWDRPNAAVELLDSLLTDRRGNRRGLPAVVQEELQALRTQAQAQAHTARKHAAHSDEILRARILLESAGYRVIPPGG